MATRIGKYVLRPVGWSLFMSPSRKRLLEALTQEYDDRLDLIASRAEQYGLTAGVSGERTIDQQVSRRHRSGSLDNPMPARSSLTGSPTAETTGPKQQPRRVSEFPRITTEQPRSYQEARTIGEVYRNGLPVIMNLAELDEPAARRLTDFAAGLAFALRGSIDKVTNRVYLLTPADIDISADDASRRGERGLSVPTIPDEKLPVAPGNPATAPDTAVTDRATEMSRITTLQPASYNEARTIGELYRDDVPVILNFTELDDLSAKRLIDFSAGLAFALRGSIDKVTNRVFLLMPANIRISAEDARQLAERGLFWPPTTASPRTEEVVQEIGGRRPRPAEPAEPSEQSEFLEVARAFKLVS